MKPWTFLLLLFLSRFAFAEDENKETLLQLPTEVLLTSGLQLKNVSVVRWTKETVILKHSGGRDPISYASIVPAQRPIFEKWRDIELGNLVQGQLKVTPGEPARKILNGQIFISTNGAGSYKLGGVTVRAYPISVLAAFYNGALVYLPKPLSKTVTDADGKFTMAAPTELFFIFAQAKRLTESGWENYAWHVAADKFPNPDFLILSNDNVSIFSPVSFAE